jgi:hypothetical protein
MVVRLILDTLARGPGLYLLLLPVLVLGWPMVAMARMPREALLALSMSAAFCISTTLRQGMVTREVVIMPIAARDLWLARWWLGTVVAVLCTALPKLLVPMQGLSFALLSMLCDFAYTGVCLALWSVFDIKPRGPLWRRVLLVRSGMILWLLTIGGGAVAWSFVLRPVLPTEWAHLSGPAGLVMLVALAVTLLGYLYVPPQGAPREVARARASVASMPLPRSTASRRPTASRTPITGIALVLWRDAVVSVTYAALVVGAVLLVWWFQSPAGISVTLDRIAYVLFPRPGEFFGRSAWLVLLFSCFPAGLFWYGILRHVRTLPISTMQIIGLLLAIPLSRWLAVWLIVAMLFALDGRAPARFGPDTLAAFTGIAALMQAGGLRWNNVRRPWMLLMVVFTGLVAIPLGQQFFPAVVAFAERFGLSAPAFVGLVSIAAACLLHYDTLTRRSATYRLPHIGYDAFTPGLS